MVRLTKCLLPHRYDVERDQLGLFGGRLQLLGKQLLTGEAVLDTAFPPHPARINHHVEAIDVEVVVAIAASASGCGVPVTV